MKLIEMNIDKIAALCRKYKVAKLWVFGSILTDRFNDDSDVDFSVSFDKKNIPLLDYADNYLDFLDELKALLSESQEILPDAQGEPVCKERYLTEEQAANNRNQEIF